MAGFLEGTGTKLRSGRKVASCWAGSTDFVYSERRHELWQIALRRNRCGIYSQNLCAHHFISFFFWLVQEWRLVSIMARMPTNAKTKIKSFCAILENRSLRMNSQLIAAKLNRFEILPPSISGDLATYTKDKQKCRRAHKSGGIQRNMPANIKYRSKRDGWRTRA